MCVHLHGSSPCRRSRAAAETIYKTIFSNIIKCMIAWLPRIIYTWTSQKQCSGLRDKFFERQRMEKHYYCCRGRKNRWREKKIVAFMVSTLYVAYICKGALARYNERNNRTNMALLPLIMTFSVFFGGCAYIHHHRSRMSVCAHQTMPNTKLMMQCAVMAFKWVCNQFERVKVKCVGRNLHSVHTVEISIISSLLFCHHRIWWTVEGVVLLKVFYSDTIG